MGSESTNRSVMYYSNNIILMTRCYHSRGMISQRVGPWAPASLRLVNVISRKWLPLETFKNGKRSPRGKRTPNKERQSRGPNGPHRFLLELPAANLSRQPSCLEKWKALIEAAWDSSAGEADSLRACRYLRYEVTSLLPSAEIENIQMRLSTGCCSEAM